MLTIHLSGPLRITLENAPVGGLSRRGQAMLAVLALQPGLRAERMRLADLLWSDRSEDQARASLRQELSTLRRALPNGAIDADRQCVWLDETLVTVDQTGEGGLLDGFDLNSEGFEDWLRERRQAETQAHRPVPVSRGSGDRPSLAVLPFDEFGVHEADMFADGVVDEITATLSRVRDFHVIARQSAFALAPGTDLREAATALGADYLVEGAIRRGGDRVRITVQLVRGSDARMLWSERFDDRLDDLFDLQDRIAGQVAGQLSPNLRLAEIARARSRPREDRTAYELVLAAMPHFWVHDRAENARAVQLFDKALTQTPNYPLAMAMKAWALAQQTSYLWARDPKRVHEEAMHLAERATADAGDHVLTLVGAGAAISMCSDQVDRARLILERAVTIDPNNAWGWMRLGFVGVYTDQHDDARAAFDRAMALSPLDPYRHNMILGRGMAEFRGGNFELARELIERGMKESAAGQWALRPLISIYLALGREEEALRVAEAFKAAHPGVTMRLILDSLPPTFAVTFPIYMEGLRKVGVPEE